MSILARCTTVGQSVPTPRGVALVPPELDDDADLFRRTVEAARDAMSRPLTTEEVEPFMYRPEPEPLPEPYIPTDEDLRDYGEWSESLDYHASVREHACALNVWLTFFPE